MYLQKFIFKFFNSPRKFQGDIGKTEKVFRALTDPWDYKSSRYEKQRFDEITKLVREVAPKNMLEIGCAEGYLTEELYRICRNITCLEISPTAIERARIRVPHANYISGDFTKSIIGKTRRFDLVVASEVLYYPKRMDTILFLKNLMARYLLTSNAWNMCLQVERIIRKSGFKKIKNKWVGVVEGMDFKMAKISLWEYTELTSKGK